MAATGILPISCGASRKGERRNLASHARSARAVRVAAASTASVTGSMTTPCSRRANSSEPYPFTRIGWFDDPVPLTVAITVHDDGHLPCDWTGSAPQVRAALMMTVELPLTA